MGFGDAVESVYEPITVGGPMSGTLGFVTAAVTRRRKATIFDVSEAPGCTEGKKGMGYDTGEKLCSTGVTCVVVHAITCGFFCHRGRLGISSQSNGWYANEGVHVCDARFFRQLIQALLHL
jgi:hypothetical protein